MSDNSFTLIDWNELVEANDPGDSIGGFEFSNGRRLYMNRPSRLSIAGAISPENAVIPLTNTTPLTDTIVRVDATPDGPDESDAGFRPLILAGQEGATLAFTPVYIDNFEDSQGSLFERWQPITMQDELHRAGNHGIDRNGNPGASLSVAGKRWSAWYENPSAVAKVVNGGLEMRARLYEQSDPTRLPFMQDGELVQFDKYRIDLAFLTTWHRHYSSELGDFVTHPDSAGRAWGPGHFMEFEVDLRRMQSAGCRLSISLLPYGASPEDSRYDVFGYDPSTGFENHLQIKAFAGQAAGSTPGGSVDIKDKLESTYPDFDLRTGTHKISVLWQASRLIAYVDGVEVQRDDEVGDNGQLLRLLSVPHYLVVSREANSGVKYVSDPIGDGDIAEEPPYRPGDPSLYASNVWFSRSSLNNDVGRVLSVHVYSVNGDNSVMIGDPMVPA